MSTCAQCGAELDIGSTGCRVCGEGLPERTQPSYQGPIDNLLDQLGEWSQIKHDILEKYAGAYTTILKSKASIRKLMYLDVYAGTGFGADRYTGQQLEGSAIRAMQVQPPFDELHFVEGDYRKADVLEQATALDRRVTVHRGDGTTILREQLLPLCTWERRCRALCLIDPYDLSVPWSALVHIARMRSVEIFYNFMIMDANRNFLWKNLEYVPQDRLPYMDMVWGDRSWVPACYIEQPNLLGGTDHIKRTNRHVAHAFRNRLETVAGFGFVPEPIAMKNSTNATVYYLFFASHNSTAGNIVADIFNKYR